MGWIGVGGLPPLPAAPIENRGRLGLILGLITPALAVLWTSLALDVILPSPEQASEEMN